MKVCGRRQKPKQPQGAINGPHERQAEGAVTNLQAVSVPFVTTKGGDLSSSQRGRHHPEQAAQSALVNGPEPAVQHRSVTILRKVCCLHCSYTPSPPCLSICSRKISVFIVAVHAGGGEHVTKPGWKNNPPLSTRRHRHLSKRKTMAATRIFTRATGSTRAERRRCEKIHSECRMFA